MLTFHFRSGWLEPKSYGALVLLFTAGLTVTASLVIAIPARVAAFAMAFPRGAGRRWLVWLGTVSYSLYLLHVPIGGRIVNFGERLVTDPLARVGVLAAALAASLIAAALYHRPTRATRTGVVLAY